MAQRGRGRNKSGMVDYNILAFLGLGSERESKLTRARALKLAAHNARDTLGST